MAIIKTQLQKLSENLKTTNNNLKLQAKLPSSLQFLKLPEPSKQSPQSGNKSSNTRSFGGYFTFQPWQSLLEKKTFLCTTSLSSLIINHPFNLYFLSSVVFLLCLLLSDMTIPDSFNHFSSLSHLLLTHLISCISF